jgi:hypothetical protein
MNATSKLVIYLPQDCTAQDLIAETIHRLRNRFDRESFAKAVYGLDDNFRDAKAVGEGFDICYVPIAPGFLTYSTKQR